MTDPVLVCGLGRCGTTLVMQMLHEGGVQIFADSLASYESDRLTHGADIAALLPDLGGKAAKILDPHRAKFPASLRAKVIWIDREAREQAKSQLKFLRLIAGIDLPGQQWRAIAKSLLSDRGICLTMLRGIGADILVLKFEAILSGPDKTARAIAEFVGGGIDVARMAACIIPRSPRCAPDMRIELEAVARELSLEQGAARYE